MPESFLSDELLRQLIAVGQVDVLVGLPTLNNEATVGPVVRAIQEAFTRPLARERTVMINSDGGSTDGTLEAIRQATQADAETLLASHPLRTVHRISTPYHALPGRTGALHTILAAADLTQARAVAIVSPDVTSVTAGWIEALVRPVLRDGMDFVGPVYARHLLEGPLVTQLVRPLTGAAYGWRLREPVGGEFACTGAFARTAVEECVWDSDLARDGIDLWLATTALARDVRVGQAQLGPRVLAPTAGRPGLPELLQQVVGSLFACLDQHEKRWLTVGEFRDVPLFDGVHAPAADAPAFDPAPLDDSFRAGVQDLEPLHARILAPATLEPLRRAAADGAGGGHFDYSDALWAHTVYDFAAAHHHGAMRIEHLTRALVPLYLGRVASLARRVDGTDPAQGEGVLQSLRDEFERSRPYLLDRWAKDAQGVSHG